MSVVGLVVASVVAWVVGMVVGWVAGATVVGVVVGVLPPLQALRVNTIASSARAVARFFFMVHSSKSI